MSNNDDKKAKVISILSHLQPKRPTTTPRKKAPPKATQSIVGNGNIQVGGDININKKETVRNIVQPGPQHISGAQASIIKELIDQAVERDSKSGKDTSKLYASWWSKLKKHFNVTSYLLIPCNQGDEAINWMKQQLAILRPKLRRTDNDAWRKTHYAVIHASLKTMGRDKTWFYDLVYEKVGKRIYSTTDLGERDLEKMAGIVRRMSKK